MYLCIYMYMYMFCTYTLQYYDDAVTGIQHAALLIAVQWRPLIP